MDARIKRLLVSRVDAPALIHALDLYSRGAAAARLSAAGTAGASRAGGASSASSSSDPLDFLQASAGLERGAAAAVAAFLADLGPAVETWRETVEAVDTLSAAVESAERSIDASARAAEDFVASAADLERSARRMRDELQAARQVAAAFSIRQSVADALTAGPGAAIGGANGFFAALDTLLSLKRRMEAQIHQTTTTTTQGAGADADAATAALASLAGDGARAIIAEQLDVATRLEAAAMDLAFDWSLQACDSAEDGLLLTAAGGADFLPTASREPVFGALRKAVVLFASYRPAYLSSVQRGFVHARRGIFLRRFLGTVSSAAAAAAAAGSLEQQLSELLAVVHSALAEEDVLLTAVFPETVGRDTTGGEAAGGRRAGGPAGEASAVVSSPSSAAGGVTGVVTTSRMLADICDTISTPVSIRLSAVLDDAPAVSTSYRCLDVLLFYRRKFGGPLLPHDSALVLTLEQAAQRAKGRAEELRALFAERIKSFPPSLPTKLVPAPLTADVCAELDQLLVASVGVLSDKELPEHIDASSAVASAVAPLLDYCRASAEGMDVTSMSIWMINNASSVQSSLSPHPHTADTVQMLAGEVAVWEDSLVASVSNEVLKETGMLGKLAAIRAGGAPENNAAAPSTPLSALPGLGPDQLLQTLTSFVRKVTSPSVLATLDLVSHPKVRARTRRDVCALLCSAYAKFREAVVDPRNNYGASADLAGAIGSLPEDLSVLLGS
jgi:hypothetical protein